MNRRPRVTRFLRNVSNLNRSLLLIVSLAILGCESQDTPAVATPPAPVGSQEASDQGLRLPFSPVPANPDQVAQAAPPASSQGQPNITAKAAILVDGWGRVIYEKNADQRLPSASTQKLLLGILVSERGNLNGSMTIEEPDTWAEPHSANAAEADK